MPPKHSTKSSATWLFLWPQRVVVVALVEGYVAFACGVIETRARGEAALAAPEHGAAEGLLRGAEAMGVAHAPAAGRGGAGSQGRGHF